VSPLPYKWKKVRYKLVQTQYGYFSIQNSIGRASNMHLKDLPIQHRFTGITLHV
jgi:hypothetical protein